MVKFDPYILMKYEAESRPWGMYEVLLDSDTTKVKRITVAPGGRLSYQYHHRRAEIWRVFKGKVGISRSFDDIEKPVKILNEKDQIKLKKGERHRLIGLDDYAVISEIWQHTDPDHLSDENDIVRISDDYGR